MHNIRLILFLTAFLATGQKSHAQSEIYSYPVLNWGIRAGLNAYSTNNYHVYSETVELESERNENKVGYNLTILGRINLNRFFMQPELAWNLYRQDLSFTLADSVNSYRQKTDLSVRYYSYSINMLSGFNIIKEGPFLFNVLLGSSYKYIYSTTFDMKTAGRFANKTPYYKYSGIAGFSINIAKAYFDVRYEFNFPDNNIRLSDIPDYLQDIHIDKNENILNFSFGLLF
ncbi:MAG: PorT family protein [Candidatus Symbiothrix sp.]|jgi:hypothetical protein|nr:PorT family protein [Candidatus Symbiothrix sp.]